MSATGSIEIISDPYPSIRVPAESNGRSSRPGTSLQIGRLVSKVEPLYPQDALRQRIAGTVKVHVVIGRNGTVERAEPLNGPSLLEEAALRAVQQWHYEPTILGGAAIEVEEDITVVFRSRVLPSCKLGKLACGIVRPIVQGEEGLMGGWFPPCAIAAAVPAAIPPPAKPR